MQSITKDGVVHYITKLEDFQELMPYEVYKGMSSFLQSQLNTMEEEYEDSLSAVRSDLNLLDEKYDELEAEKDTFRHTFCTRMAENGMDVKVLQGIMGHKTIEVTMLVYNHDSIERSKNEVERVASALIV